ncbi:MAG: 3-isopropylmalate dehydrogenase [Dehalococcoidia bacterium]|nr:MAG: 3-isopropylmalate dehydrogenase [Dehalococcoidia bacterium]
MKFDLAVLPGDGVGPEIIDEAIKVLLATGQKFKQTFNLRYGLVGGVAIDQAGNPLPPKTLKLCQTSDAVLLGAVGGPKWDDPRARTRPEDGLLTLRKKLGLFANLRPVKVFPALVDASSLKPKLIEGVDFIFIRELTGGIYFGRPKREWQTPQGRRAVDSMTYTEAEIERILRVGFELARTRRHKLVSVDKANVLQTSRLWRQIATEIAPQYPDVELEHILVDACAMWLMLNPARFDVIVTENMFGDILTDESSILGGSMGMLASASLAGIPREETRTLGMYEPIHGSAPQIAGLNIANPIATILSAAMMLRYSLGLTKEARVIERAVEKVLDEGYRTSDIMGEGKTKVGTKEMGNLIAGKVGG